MPHFTIETTYLLPVYRQRSYEAPSLAEACGAWPRHFGPARPRGPIGPRAPWEPPGEPRRTWEGLGRVWQDRAANLALRFGTEKKKEN